MALLNSEEVDNTLSMRMSDDIRRSIKFSCDLCGTDIDVLDTRFATMAVTNGQRTLLPDEDDQQSVWSVCLRERKVRMVAAVGQLLFRLVDCTGAEQHRNEDEEVITLDNTPKAWSWQTATDRS